MPHRYRFGPIEVRPAERRLLVEGRPATLGARAFDVLLALIERRDRVVGKDELLDLVWPGLVVEENNLQVQISTLRKILGANAIATVSGRGYRFVLEPEPHEEGLPSPPASARHNLPAALNSFIGRERETREVRDLLAAAPLVTLTGVGGTGKTRLCLELAARSLEDYPHGVWLVELAPLTDPRLVPQALASVLGVKEEAGGTVLDALSQYLKDRQLLLVLDNCEHLVDACASLAQTLLKANPRLRALVSSREPLHVAGETIYTVAPLPVPEAHAAIGAEALAANDSARLFVDRAAAAQPSFRITDANAAAVAKICRHLDGIPLALELAAARVRTLAVEAIAARLGDRFRLLVGGERTALPRQQTLRALFDWSYDLLDDRERALLRRLAVFAGSWTVEAAEAVTAGDRIDELAVLDIMTSLVEKSLVAREADSARYRLLETVRQYAQEKLEDSGEADATHARHLAHYLALAEKASIELIGREQAAWLARLDPERENLLAAHAWCGQAPKLAEAGLRLVCALKNYWMTRGQLGLAHRLALEALERPGAEARTALRSRALSHAGELDSWMGRYDSARQYLLASLAIAGELGDHVSAGPALHSLGLAALGQGDWPAAREYFEKAIALAKQLGNKRDLATALNALAQLHRAEGRTDAAEPLYDQTVALARELGDRESIAVGLLNLAMVSIGRGRIDAAEPMLVDAIQIAEEVGSRLVGQSAMDVGAALAASAGRWERAARLYGMAQAQLGLMGLRRDPADEAFLTPFITAARQALGAAAFEALQSSAGATGYSESLAEARAP